MCSEVSWINFNQLNWDCKFSIENIDNTVRKHLWIRNDHANNNKSLNKHQYFDLMKQPAIYILTNQRNGTLYTGVTSDLIKRVYQHKNDFTEGFTKKYQTHLLVYFELHGTMDTAISREKQLKNWQRAWKINLIEKGNPCWNDLYNSLL